MKNISKEVNRALRKAMYAAHPIRNQLSNEVKETNKALFLKLLLQHTDKVLVSSHYTAQNLSELAARKWLADRADIVEILDRTEFNLITRGIYPNNEFEAFYLNDWLNKLSSNRIIYLFKNASSIAPLLGSCERMMELTAI